MANEIKVVELLGVNNSGDPRRFTISSSAVVAKGTLMTLSDPRTAAACVASNAMIAGIAAEGHDGLDFSDSISVWTNGIFEMYASGAEIAVGESVISGVTNSVMGDSASNADGGKGAAIIGYALETGSPAETINVRVRL